MRTLYIAAVAAASSLAFGTAARAADAPYSYGGGGDYGYGAAPAVQETWNGFYVGGLIGYGLGDASGFEPDGFLGGLTAGINYQVDAFLFGVEGDITLTGIGDEIAGEEYNLDWVGTLRGRIGYAFDRFVVYGTGGFAWTNAEYSTGGLSDSHFHGGWTVGGGVEAAVTANVSAKFEYLYMDFSDAQYGGGGGYIEPDLHTFRIGLNYRF